VILSQVPIQKLVYRLLGPPSSGIHGRRWACPLCGKHALCINVDENVFECKVCQVLGDVYDLAALHFDCDRLEAIGKTNFMFSNRGETCKLKMS
jgi:hypothetical protein